MALNTVYIFLNRHAILKNKPKIRTAPVFCGGRP